MQVLWKTVVCFERNSYTYEISSDYKLNEKAVYDAAMSDSTCDSDNEFDL